MDNKILVIDDEPDILKTLEMALSQEAYHVATATGGEAALELFRRQQFHLVITDMRMPGMDGIEVIRRLKELDPDVEAIVLTGYATLKNAIVALRSVGAFDYLTKPLENIDELFMTVEKALENRRLTLENRALLHNLKEKEAELILQNQALRESEKKYRDLAESLPVKLFEMDATGTVTFLNPFALERLQYSREDLARGLHVKDMVDPKQWDKAQKDVMKMVAEKSSETIDSVAKRKDGTTFPVLVNIHPFLHENGVSGLRGFAVDITERKQRFEEMIRMAKLESLGTLAGGIAHDFNNILAVILGNIEVAKIRMNSETPVARALSNAVEGCMAATELTRRFITFSKGGHPRKKTIPMGAMLNTMAPLFFSGSNVEYESHIPQGLWMAHVDEVQLSQAIHNVVLNAIEAMPHGGVVSIRAENTEITDHTQTPGSKIPAGLYVKVEIQDQGGGISEEHKSRVFDPYFSTKDRGAQKGMGLGLSTALSIVKKHGGFMFLESNVPLGTTVTLYFPAALQEEKKAKAAPEAPVLGGDAPPKGLKVLVMDDEAMLRELVEMMLQRLGYHAETAKDGNEAVALYKEALETSEPFDLVIFDLTVKGGPGGREAIRELLKLDSDVKAVVCSGYTDDPVMLNCAQYGFRASLAKPFLMASLKDALRKALA